MLKRNLQVQNEKKNHRPVYFDTQDILECMLQQRQGKQLFPLSHLFWKKGLLIV